MTSLRSNTAGAAQIDWADLLDRHGAALVLCARRWCPTHADSEDAVQAGVIKFLRLWQPDKGDPVPYLFRSVRHAAIDQARQRHRRLKWHQEAARLDEEPAREPLFEGNPDPERRRKLEAALDELAPEQKEVLVMKVWGELTFEQIAKALNRSPNTVASRFRYGIAGMRRLLGREGGA